MPGETARVRVLAWGKELALHFLGSDGIMAGSGFLSIFLPSNTATSWPNASHLSRDRKQLKGLLLTLVLAKLGESLGEGPATGGLLDTCGEREPDPGDTDIGQESTC